MNRADHGLQMLVLGCLFWAVGSPALAAELVLKDGRILRGRLAYYGGLGEGPGGGAPTDPRPSRSP